MAYGITPTGFVKKTFAEFKQELESDWLTVFPNADLDPDGEIGQRIAMRAQQSADIWDLAQELYTMNNPNEATGASQDNLYGNRGLTRIDASPTTIKDALHWGSAGTAIAAGSKAKQSSTLKVFSLQASVTISNSLCRQLRLAVEAPSNGKAYNIRFDSMDFPVTAGPSDTKDSIGAAYVAILGTWIEYAAGILTLHPLDGAGHQRDFYPNSFTSLDVISYANAGEYSCDSDGSFPAPIGTLDTIVTPISGWSSVSNPYAGVTGREVETDTEFRIRQNQYFNVGKATDAAIQGALMNNVTGIISASVYSNREDYAVDGQEPHSTECVVEGGADADVAQQILDTIAAGIKPVGDSLVDLPDSQGRTQHIRFSRPIQALIWVKVQYSLNTEEAFPVGGVQGIKDAIVAWALVRYRTGVNVYRRELLTPINTIPGLGDVIVTLGNSQTYTPPSSYDAVDLPMGRRTTAVFDATRITVVSL